MNEVRLYSFNKGKHIFMNELEKRAKKHKKKLRGLGGTLNPNAGNVEHNINMFNHMNSPAGGPSNNPVSGPFGGDVSAPSVGGCCEALEDTSGKRKFRLYYWDPNGEGTDTLNSPEEFKNYYDANESYEDVWATDEDDAYEKFMASTGEKYEVTGIEEFILNNQMRKSLGESAETKYYMAKYRGAFSDTLHKVYFSCDGDIEDAEKLLDELISEPYTDARVLGSVDKKSAERDGFTCIGDCDNKSLDDDFNMSARTLW